MKEINNFHSDEYKSLYIAIKNLKKELFKLKIVSFIYKTLDWLEDKLSKII